MKNLHHRASFGTTGFRLVMLAAAFCAAAAIAPLSHASAPPVTITIVNNSSLEIRQLYLSPANSDDWGGDQLSGSSIYSGGTRTLQVSWEGSSIKLVAEDKDGCFLTTTAETASGVEWTITGDTPRNCGN